MSRSTVRGKKHVCSTSCHHADTDDEKTPLLSKSHRNAANGPGSEPDVQVITQTSTIDSLTHCHRKKQGDNIDKIARRKLIIASILCLVFMTGEIVGGVLANSLAIVTDAAHLLTDLASFMISLFSLYFATRPATKKMSFGWWRAEVMGALVSVLLIWVVTAILVFMAVQRVIKGDFVIEANIMLITAAAGVAINLIMGLTLHQGHGHSHGGAGSNINSDIESSTASLSQEMNSESEQENKKLLAKKKVNINVRAAFIHVLGDLLQSLGVLTAAFIIYFKPEWKIADPICTFLFSVLVLITTITILRDALNVLMEGAPRGLNFNEVKKSFYEIEGVKDVHNLRLWCLTLDKSAVSVHLAIGISVMHQDILNQASKIMWERFGIFESTVQLEEYVEDMLDCTQCKDPED